MSGMAQMSGPDISVRAALSTMESQQKNCSRQISGIAGRSNQQKLVGELSPYLARDAVTTS